MEEKKEREKLEEEIRDEAAVRCFLSSSLFPNIFPMGSPRQISRHACFFSVVEPPTDAHSRFSPSSFLSSACPSLVFQTHRLHLTEELTARQDRLLALRRAARELDLQRALMSKGAKAPKLATAKDGGRGEKGRREDEWWMGGGKSGTGKEEQGRGGMAPGTYQEEGGEGTGARVWVRSAFLFFFLFLSFSQLLVFVVDEH